MARGGVRIPILAEFDPAGIKKAEQSLGDIAKTAAAAFATTKIVEFGREAINAAADMGETISKAGVLFGESVGNVERFAEGAASALGQSKQQALDAAATFATFGKSAGLAGADLATFSTDFVTLASDLASFNNTTPEQAIEAIGAALRGEAEPMRQFGVLLDDATLRQRALEMGITDTIKNALTPQQKVLAAQAEIFAQTSDAQGDFARTSDSLANQQKILAAEMENVKAELGEALLPVMKQLAGIALDVLGAFQQLPEPMQKLAGVTALAGGAFVSASKSLQGLGLAAGKANKALGAIGLLIGGAIAVYGAYTSSKREAEAATQEFVDALQAEADGQKGAIDAAIAADLATEDMQKRLEAVGISSLDVAKFIKGETSPAFEELAEKVAAATQKSLSADEQSRRLKDAFGENGVAARNLAIEVGDLRAAYSLAETQIERQTEVERELATVSSELSEQIKISEQEAYQFGDAIMAVTEGLDEQTEATKEAEDALNGLLNQTLAMFDADLAYESQLQKTADAIYDYAIGMAEGTLQGRDLEEAMRDVRTEAINQAEAALKAAEAQAELDGNTLSAADQQRILVGEIQKVADALDPSSPLRAQLNAYIFELGAIPASKETVITTRRQEIIETSRVESFQFSPGAIAAQSRPRQSRNIGGPVFGIEGRSVPITAHGGEYVLSADVVDAIKRGAPSRGLGRGGAVSGTGNVINITVTSADPQAVVDAIRKYNKTNGPAPIRIAS